MREVTYMEYADYMSRTSNAFCDLLSGAYYDVQTAEYYNLSMDEIRLIQNHIWNDRGFDIVFSELCSDKFGAEYVKKWERNKRYVDANKNDEEYLEELELLKLHGNVLGPLRLMFGNDIQDVREVILHERDKNKLNDWGNAVSCCSSLADFLEYINSDYSVDHMLVSATEAMNQHIRETYGMWD